MYTKKIKIYRQIKYKKLNNMYRKRELDDGGGRSHHGSKIGEERRLDSKSGTRPPAILAEGGVIGGKIIKKLVIEIRNFGEKFGRVKFNLRSKGGNSEVILYD